MGNLSNFDLSSYNCNVYVETGTGQCGTLSTAFPHFETCYSVDIEKEFVTNAKGRYPTAVVDCGLSIEVLERWLRHSIKQSDRVLFFLDAHFPGADFKGARYSVDAPNAVPLKEEIELIKKYRPNCKDVIICDDARIYMIGDFAGGNVEYLQVPGGIDFIYDLYPKEKVSILYFDEGYIVIDNR